MTPMWGTSGRQMQKTGIQEVYRKKGGWQLTAGNKKGA